MIIKREERDNYPKLQELKDRNIYTIDVGELSESKIKNFLEKFQQKIKD